MTELSRRQFVAVAAGCAAMCACGGLAMAEPASTEPIDVGTVADYAKDGVSDKFVKSHKLFVIREENQIFACTAICPHKGAVLSIKGDEIYCKRHGSEFSNEGSVTKGPADSSLERYAISKDDKGHLIVDPKKTFREKNWTDDGSFVKV